MTKGAKKISKKAKRVKSKTRPKNGLVPGRIHTKSGIKKTDVLIQCMLPVKAARTLSARAKAAKVSRASLVRKTLLKAV